MIRPADDKPLKGGLGGGAPGPLIPQPPPPNRTEASDIKLMGQAVRQKWNVPDLVLEKLPLHMARIATDENRDDRPRIAASRVLVQMVAQNNDDGKTQNLNVGVNVTSNDVSAFIRVEAAKLDSQDPEVVAQLAAAFDQIERLNAGNGA